MLSLQGSINNQDQDDELKAKSDAGINEPVDGLDDAEGQGPQSEAGALSEKGGDDFQYARDQDFDNDESVRALTLKDDVDYDDPR